jgi:3-hydroxybutyryl-CoA dehydratase
MMMPKQGLSIRNLHHTVLATLANVRLCAESSDERIFSKCARQGLEQRTGFHMTEERGSMNELGGYEFQDLRPGMSATFAKTITEADIVMFAGVSGDNNAIHINEEFAASTLFKGRIAHGMLSASVISAAIANKLPGPGTVYMSQSLRFRAPVRAGDTVRATVTVKELIPERCRVLLGTDCAVGGQVVIEGEALVALPPPSRDRP